MVIGRNFVSLTSMKWSKLKKVLFPKKEYWDIREECGDPVYVPGVTFHDYVKPLTRTKKDPVYKQIVTTDDVCIIDKTFCTCVEDKMFHCPLPAYFCVTGITQSPAEVMIATILNQFDCVWFSEVSFYDFPSAKGYYRFDFLIPDKHLIIEYDSKMYHSSYEQKATDTRKDAWCWEHGITVKRFNEKHYYNMDAHITNLLKHHNIHKK